MRKAISAGVNLSKDNCVFVCVYLCMCVHLHINMAFVIILRPKVFTPVSAGPEPKS